MIYRLFSRPLAFLAPLALLPMLIMASPGSAAGTPNSGSIAVTSNSITVSASGIVTVAPDMATVTLGAQATRFSAQEAQSEVNKIAAATLRALQKLAIADRDIQTQGVALEPQYNSSNVLTGYRASETLQVTVNKLSQTGAVIDAGVAAGANANVGISFGLRDDNPAHLSALRLAVQNARARALTVADELGMKSQLAHAHIQISSTATTPPVPFYAAAKSTASADGTPAQVLAGTLSIEEDVTLTYLF